eukprot:TRINITY_DN6583_c0_g1_i1.p1 TRINITY_DN6583_c0_g1~~TRINITY_DN6583_c0_g1_i1.p1  ORF type:complete len:298 (+),score=54.54 TRINITY_DN6583_c0_g1_i1:80-895(+)
MASRHEYPFGVGLEEGANAAPAAGMAGSSHQQRQQRAGDARNLKAYGGHLDRYIHRRQERELEQAARRQTGQMDDGSQSATGTELSSRVAMRQAVDKSGLIRRLITVLREKGATPEQVNQIRDSISDAAQRSDADSHRVAGASSVPSPASPADPDELQVFQELVKGAAAGHLLPQYPDSLSGQSRLVLDNLYAAVRGIVGNDDEDTGIARRAAQLSATTRGRQAAWAAGDLRGRAHEHASLGREAEPLTASGAAARGERGAHGAAFDAVSF